MKIQVLSNYDNVQAIEASNLKRLIAEKNIIAFRRAEGWVKLGIDPVRGEGGVCYDGPERRNIVQKTIPHNLKKG
jgi:hypothetical protein